MQPISVSTAFAFVEQFSSAGIAIPSSYAWTDAEKITSKQLHIDSVVLQLYVLMHFFAPYKLSRYHHLVRMGLSSQCNQQWLGSWCLPLMMRIRENKLSKR
jgi:hypothetical protein